MHSADSTALMKRHTCTSNHFSMLHLKRHLDQGSGQIGFNTIAAPNPDI
jgi:hypothetical protein